jgi:hypothetical protein
MDESSVKAPGGIPKFSHSSSSAVIEYLSRGMNWYGLPNASPTIPPRILPIIFVDFSVFMVEILITEKKRISE